jgi:hypothetical protein
LRAHTADRIGTPDNELVGVVTDLQGTPIADAEVSLNREGNATENARSNAEGKFVFANVSEGSVSITVHHLGYRQRTLTLKIAPSVTRDTVRIELVAVPTDLDSVVIEGSAGRLQEFTEHRKQSKFGHFLDQNQIREESPRYVSELFKKIPGARLAPSNGFGSKLELRGCRPKIWLDGVLAQDAEIDEVINPSEIAGIEIYSSWAGVPAQYMDRENRACGAVIIWSRKS